jgi:hypothetical protein
LRSAVVDIQILVYLPRLCKRGRVRFGSDDDRHRVVRPAIHELNLW